MRQIPHIPAVVYNYYFQCRCTSALYIIGYFFFFTYLFNELINYPFSNSVKFIALTPTVPVVAAKLIYTYPMAMTCLLYLYSYTPMSTSMIIAVYVYYYVYAYVYENECD